MNAGRTSGKVSFVVISIFHQNVKKIFPFQIQRLAKSDGTAVVTGSCSSSAGSLSKPFDTTDVLLCLLCHVLLTRQLITNTQDSPLAATLSCQHSYVVYFHSLGGSTVLKPHRWLLTGYTTSSKMLAGC